MFTVRWHTRPPSMTRTVELALPARLNACIMSATVRLHCERRCRSGYSDIWGCTVPVISTMDTSGSYSSLRRTTLSTTSLIWRLSLRDTSELFSVTCMSITGRSVALAFAVLMLTPATGSCERMASSRSLVSRNV